MFSIDKRSSFSLKPPEFSCDQPIHKQIVPPLPCTPFFLTITGSAGSVLQESFPRGALHYSGTFRRISEKEHFC